MTIPLSFSPIDARLRFERLGPSSPARLDWFANALRDAYFERPRRARVSNHGETIERPRLGANDLLRRITRLIERETARGGDPAGIQVALRAAFNAGDADDLRSSVIHLVESGDMRPSEAAHCAGAFGWKPFTGWADPSLFDPMKVPMWTLAMTAAWIRWREHDRERAIDQVRRHWPAYREASTRWIETEDGHEIGPREDQGYFEIPGEPTDTKRLLCEALESGGLRAERYKDGASVTIPANDWAFLKIVGFHDEDGVRRVIAPDGSEIDVHVPREQVMAAFSESIPVWKVELEARILADAAYGQERAVREMKQFAQASETIPSDREIRAAWKRIKGIEGTAKRGRRPTPS